MTQTKTRTSDRRWLILAVIVAAQFMVILDSAIVNIALPSIKRDLDFSQETLQWVVSACSIVFGGMLLLGGGLADRMGRRRVFMAGVCLFSAASLVCGFAWSSGALIVARGIRTAPGVRAWRRRTCPRLGCCPGRRPRQRRGNRCRDCGRAPQCEPPDWRRDRSRGRDHRCNRADPPLPARTRRRWRSDAALTHGFSIAFYVLAALALLGAAVAGLFLDAQGKTDKRQDFTSAEEMA